MEMGGSIRWLFKCSAWNPTASELTSCLALLPPSQQNGVIRFVKFEDQKRALVSRLMQHMLLHMVFNVPYKDIVILRTREGKPYVECCFRNSSYPNLNFNVSHHGDYVALASEPLWLVGLDIMAAGPKECKVVDEYIRNFKSYFTRLEWKNIQSVGPDSDSLLHQFSRYWCLKESFIKAIGSGLGFELRRAEFFFEDCNLWGDVAYLRLDGVERTDWFFYLTRLDDNHWACVAKGPPADAIESFRETLPVVDADESSMAMAYEQHKNPFTKVSIHDIIPHLSHNK